MATQGENDVTLYNYAVKLGPRTKENLFTIKCLGGVARLRFIQS